LPRRGAQWPCGLGTTGRWATRAPTKCGLVGGAGLEGALGFCDNCGLLERF